MRSASIDRLLELIPHRPVYLSIDTDVLDPAVAPGTNTPVPEGLSVGELRTILAHITRERDVIGCDFVELNPERDQHQRTSLTLAYLLLGVIGAACDRCRA
jgi:agmatinase